MSILEKINKSSRDFLLNGNLKIEGQPINNEKVYLNKLLNSDSLSKHMKNKISVIYSNFFKNQSSNVQQLNNEKDKKLKSKQENNLNDDQLTNINLIIKRKLLYDYIKRDKKKSINDNIIMRRMNRNFSNNSLNPKKEDNNSFRILKNKVFEGESFLQRNFSRQNYYFYPQTQSFTHLNSKRINNYNYNTNRNKDNLKSINNLKMRLNFY